MASSAVPIGWLLTPGATPLGEVVDLARTLEDRGFARVWMGEAWREVVVPLAALTGATSRVQLGSGILQIRPVHPVMVAQQAAQLAELRGDQGIALGLGLGAPFVVQRWFGLPADARPVARMREFLEVVRGVLRAPADGPFSYAGEFYAVKNYTLPFATRPPRVTLHLAAIGPRMQQLAGALADGIVVGGINSLAHIASTQENLALGAARAGRDVAEVEITYGIPHATADDGDRARRLARGSLVYTSQYDHYRRVWEAEGHGNVIDKVAGHVRAREMDAALALITDDMVDNYAVAGTPAECAAQLARYRAYPGTPLLSFLPFRMSDAEAMDALRHAAATLPVTL